MDAEEFLVCWFRSKFLFSTPFLFQSDNYYAKEFKPTIDKHLRKDFQKNTRERKTKKDTFKKNETKNKRKSKRKNKTR